jgi:hypothetical protein
MTCNMLQAMTPAMSIFLENIFQDAKNKSDSQITRWQNI